MIMPYFHCCYNMASCCKPFLCFAMDVGMSLRSFGVHAKKAAIFLKDLERVACFIAGGA